MTDVSQPAAGSGKDEWRAWAKEVRSAGVPESVSAAVVNALAPWLADAPDGLVVLYLPLPDEVDLTDLFERSDRTFAVTRTPMDGPLTLHPSDGPFERHRFGFDQPTADAPTLDPADVGVVLVPGLVFDGSGQRLGRGAGYYDTFLPAVPAWAPRVAIVPSWLIVDQIPTEPHDVPMTHFATEHGVRAV